MLVCCPACGRSFNVEKIDVEVEKICPNPDCHLPYQFRFFSEKDDASAFYESVPSWRTKYLLQPSRDVDKWVVKYFNEQVEPYRIRSISSLIGIEILGAIQAGSADNLGGPVTLIEINRCSDEEISFRRIEPLEYAKEGGRLPHMRRFTKFCTRLRTASNNGESGDELCKEFDLRRTKEYIEQPPYYPDWHFCWCGLVDYIVPVIVHGQIVGVLFSGQKRKDDPNANATMKIYIAEAARRLGLDVSEMTTLAFDERDVKLVDDEGIKDDLVVLKGAAKRLEDEAFRKYMAEREVREGHFLDEITSELSGVVGSYMTNDDWLRSKACYVLDRIINFIGCFDSAALLIESRQTSGKFEVLGSCGHVSRDKIIELSPYDFDQLMPDRLGPICIDPDERTSLYGCLSENLVPFRIDLGYIIRMRLGSGRYLLLMLACKSHTCSFRDVEDFCCQRSELSVRFLTRLGNHLCTTFDLLLSMHQMKNEEERRKVFLLKAAHSLSLPIQSLIADSCVLIDEGDLSPTGSDIAHHLLDEVQGLQLIIENILHAEGSQQKEDFYDYSVLEALREACMMFLGEAQEKGCDIRTYVAIDQRKVEMEPVELDDLYLLYMRMIYDSIKQELGIPKNQVVWKSDIYGEVSIGDKIIRVAPETMPRKCYEKKPRSAKIVIQGQGRELDARSLARKHLVDVSMVYDQLTLALKNVMHNALKYSYRTSPASSQRYVEVVCEQINVEYYKITITNYGIGITERELEEGLIWEPGYRGDMSTDRNRWGSGLGLTHAKQIIEEIHGGKIEAQSFQQHGNTYLTIFTITVPTCQQYRLD